MKHRITFNMWEQKKGLIIQLYREEGWPLKQVIKRVRSDEFDPSENQLRSRLRKWCITKSPHRQRCPNSLKNQGGADSNGNYLFVQTALSGALNTANNGSAGQGGAIAITTLRNDPRVSQTPSLPSTSTSNESYGTPPARTSNLDSSTKDFTPGIQQEDAVPGSVQGQLAPGMWWVQLQDGTIFLSTPYYLSAPVNPCF
ncbi:hypothetical protein BDV24DRAFT_170173 [Aspergillus arachidicola]|uniref:Clr5 domain-containing protein n=1 Tax=Aspergillus arachidicola TaxID=656916 RepID=A0A5N6XQQ0_9EURO|nr:hypothetical protein BDV24DRAFT_170173 [Aspergillus arachidicola]